MATMLVNRPVETEVVVRPVTRGVLQIRRDADDVWACSVVIYGAASTPCITRLDSQGVRALFELVGLPTQAVEQSVFVEFKNSSATKEQIAAFCLRMAS